VQRVFFADVNAATARVLAAEGCEVIVPRDQGCCGALMVHAGLEEPALQAARRLIDVFERAEVDAIVTNAAGCGSSMKEYAHLLRDDPRYAGRAKAFAAKCRDVAELLADLQPRAPRHPLAVRAAYHDACHLQHAQGVRLQPRRVLRSIPELEVLEISDAVLCCGSAGIFNLIEPQAAEELGDRKVRTCLATEPEVIASGNPGCLLQLSAGLARAGRRIPVLHTIQLLDASIRGVPRDVLLGVPRRTG
jgi:glycolate oxidase iron-sulfur subunit